MSTRPVLLHCLEGDPLSVLPFSPPLDFPRGARLVAPGTCLWRLDEGYVALRDPESWAILRVWGPEDVWLEPAPYEALALTAVRVGAYSATEVDRFLREVPKFASALTWVSLQDLAWMRRRYLNCARQSLRLRLWQALLDLAGMYGSGPDLALVGRRLELRWLTHEFLGRYLGTSREIVTFHMNYLRNAGFLRYQRGSLEILSATPPASASEADR